MPVRGIWMDFVSVCGLLLCIHLTDVYSQSVSLNSTLSGRHIAYPGEQVVFTCVTCGPLILEWISMEYIGTSSFNLQLLFDESNGTSKPSAWNPETIATLVSVSDDNGVTAMVSTLHITASSQFPMSSVTCRGRESREIITFNTDDAPAQAINSALHQNLFACPGETLCFTCVAKDTSTLSWISADYIDIGQLNVSSHHQHRTRNSSELSVTVTHDVANGTSLLTSILTVIVLPSIMDHSHTITCQNVGIGTASSVVIEREDNCSVSTTTVAVAQTGTPVRYTELEMQASETSATSEAVENIRHSLVTIITLPLLLAILEKY